MNERNIAVCVLMSSVLISSVSQILLKKAADRNYSSRLGEYLNPLVICAYGMFGASVVLTMLALKHIPLSLSPILESTGYIFVSVLGYFILGETFGKRKLLGFFLILAGIAVFSM